MVVMDSEFDKEILIYQFKKILTHLEETEDIMEILEEKPYLCGNATVLKYPRSLRINVRIDYQDIDLSMND